MKRFVIIKDNFDDFNIVSDVFRSLIGNNIEMVKKNEYNILYFYYENITDIENMLLSLTDVFMVNINSYISQYNNLDEELQIALDIMESLPSGVYTFKKALLYGNVKNKQKALDFILKSSGIDENFIKSFISCDLNVSRASKIMYTHRNTINYKLDKLYENSNFDLRKFIDAHIIYSLIK